ncbi:MAG: bifunctional demethylmenaquinone methyltransferase/2-methoxy-6-polyprenyl-1,4-benzoquinol methylase UbiE [Bacteroidota bacterium]
MITEPSKKEVVREMFNDISSRYDFLNHFLSFGIDFLWRKKLVRLLRDARPVSVLDVATGTADLAIAIAESSGAAKIAGVDISAKMLEVGRKKVTAKQMERIILLQCADAECLPFPDNSFDAITVAFGVRNFENLEIGLTEMRRVLRPGGTVLILEFSHPSSFPMKQLYTFYSAYMIPFIGRLISGNSRAYRYLPESVAAFPSGNSFLSILSRVGLKNGRVYPLSAGIASIYKAEK